MTSLRSTKVVLGIDLGTTNMKCFAYDENAKILGKARNKIPVVKLDDEGHEIQPDVLWSAFQELIRNCLQNASLTATEVSGLGISTQRATFLTWDGESWDYFHNFITWKDQRTEKLCMQWNSSLKIKLLKIIAYLLFLFTGMKLFEIASSIHFSSAMVLPRLYSLFHGNKQLQKKVSEKKVLFGTIDTWLVWKLTGGEVYATDSSNACVTGFFDLLQMKWSLWIMRLFSIPKLVFPSIKNTCDDFGETLPDIFGASIPICALVGDQQASTFGAGCFHKSDINCTIGTGAFVSVNTGSTPVALKGGYPLVGWTVASQPTYILEFGIHDATNLMDFAQAIGHFTEPEEAEDVAKSTLDCNGVYFLPDNSILESLTKSSFYTFVGIKPGTTQAHLVRSIFESLAFQLCSILNFVYTNFDVPANNVLRVGGGVSNSDLIVQLMSNVMNRQVIRMKHNEYSSLGSALLAGLYCGVWENIEDLSLLLDKYDIFTPNPVASENCQEAYHNWRNKLLTAT